MLALEPFAEATWSVDGAGTGHPTSQVTCASWVFHPPARMHVILLGPCFKTGSLEALRQHPVAAVPEGQSSHPPQTAGRHGRGINPRFFPAGPTHADLTPRGTDARTSADSRRATCFHSLPPQQFQALFDSLFKVLFIFPSRYLFAIGLLPVFSLRWNLPPT